MGNGSAYCGPTIGTTMSILQRLSHRYSRPDHTLQKRKGKYYVHVKIPRLIRFKFNGNRYLRRSTGFADLKRANIVARDIAEDLYADFRDAILSLDPIVEAARSRLNKLNVDVDNWYQGERKLRISVPLCDLEAGKHLLQSVDMEPNVGGELFEVEITDHASLIAAMDQLGFGEFSNGERDELLSKALSFQELIEISKRHPEAANTPSGVKLLQRSNEPLLRTAPTSKTIFFEEYLEAYIETRRLAGDALKQLSTRQSDCRQFIAVVGNFTLNEYENYHGIQFAKYLHGEGLANATIKRKLSYVRGLFICANEENMDKKEDDPRRIAVKIPFSGIDLSSYGVKTREYQPLTEEMLFKLFDLQMSQKQFAVLSLLITTGMRLDEICLLTWSKIFERDGCLFADLTNSNVKNQGSLRIVALHPITYPLLERRGAGKIFHYAVDKDGKSENAASRNLMPLIRKVSSNDRIVVHSLRGNFKDLMRDANVTKENHDFMTGHGEGDAAGLYGIGPSLKARAAFTAKASHPWITESRNFASKMKALFESPNAS